MGGANMSTLIELEMLPSENTNEQDMLELCEITCGVSCSVTG